MPYTHGAALFAQKIDCSKYSEQRHHPECEERAQTGIGVLTVLAVLCLVVGYVIWRRTVRKHTYGVPSAEPRKSRTEQEAARQRLREEYNDKLESRDPDVLETSRDWADNEGTPWRVEVALAIGVLVLFVSVAVLVAFFAAIKAAIG